MNRQNLPGKPALETPPNVLESLGIASCFFSDFSKVSLIPDATLVHKIPEQEEEKSDDIDYTKKTVGAWYTGQIFYSVKTCDL